MVNLIAKITRFEIYTFIMICIIPLLSIAPHQLPMAGPLNLWMYVHKN